MKLTIKTAMLEEDLDEWPSMEQRLAYHLRPGTTWLLREGPVLSRWSPPLEP